MLIDSHCHIPHKKYKKTLEELVADSLENDVRAFISVGTSLEDSRNVLESTSDRENIFATVGVYPHEDLGTPVDSLYEELKHLANSYRSKIVAIGECGIDIPEKSNPGYATRALDEQKELFKLQIGLAIEKDLPLVIHNRNGDEEVLKILEKYKNTGLRGVAHCFVSDWQTAQRFLELGFHISFTAIVTYPSAGDALLETVAKVPADKYLVETDAPYLPPQGHRGEINFPKYVKITAEKIAEIRNTSFEEVANQTFENTVNLFNLNL